MLGQRKKGHSLDSNYDNDIIIIISTSFSSVYCPTLVLGPSLSLSLSLCLSPLLALLTSQGQAWFAFIHPSFSTFFSFFFKIWEGHVYGSCLIARVVYEFIHALFLFLQGCSFYAISGYYYLLESFIIFFGISFFFLKGQRELDSAAAFFFSFVFLMIIFVSEHLQKSFFKLKFL